jgi:hypothetical protein
MTSGHYQLSAETIRNQTHLGSLNVFEKVKCSCCRQLGHNYLFCPVFDTPKLFGAIIKEFIKLNIENNITRLLLFIDLFETKILKRLALYLDIQSKTRNGMKRNIYLKIKEKYPSDKLEIISINLDDDSTSFSKAVQKYKMEWVHIFGDKKLRDVYGVMGIPEVFLINKSGEIIYKRGQEKDYDSKLPILNNLLVDSL